MIQQRWRAEQRQLPFVDGIVFGDGSLVLADRSALAHSQWSTWRPLCDSHVDHLLRYNPETWMDVDTLIPPLDLPGRRIRCGGTAWEGDLFVAAEDPTDGGLLWALCLDWAEEPHSVRVDGDLLVVTMRWPAGDILIPLHEVRFPLDPDFRIRFRREEGSPSDG